MPRKRKPADARREKGAGSYHFNEKTGYHRYRIRVDGREYEVNDRDAARAKVAFEALKERLSAGVDIVGGRQTLRAYMTAYLLGHEHRVKETTRVDYEKRADYYILTTLGDYALQDLTARIVEAWLTAMLEYRDETTGKPWALTSIGQALRLLQRCLQRAYAVDHLIRDNPAASVQVPTRRRGDERIIIEDEEGERALTVEQADSVLAEVKRTDAHQQPKDKRGRHARSAGLYVLYTLALRLGLRRGELIGLRWRDVDFKAGVIRVRQQVVRIEKRAEITTPKTDEARRTVPIPPSLATMLREHKLKTGGGTFVFPDEAGSHRRPDALTKHARRVYDRLGLQGFTFHDLRATAITRLRERGVAAETIAAIVGHKSVTTTLQTYTEVTDDRKRAALGE